VANTKRPFQFIAEIPLVVYATDPAVADRKVNAALRSIREITADVVVAAVPRVSALSDSAPPVASLASGRTPKKARGTRKAAAAPTIPTSSIRKR
jgi:hypothetical protein